MGNILDVAHNREATLKAAGSRRMTFHAWRRPDIKGPHSNAAVVTSCSAAEAGHAVRVDTGPACRFPMSEERRFPVSRNADRRVDRRSTMPAHAP